MVNLRLLLLVKFIWNKADMKMQQKKHNSVSTDIHKVNKLLSFNESWERLAIILHNIPKL